jgi:His-Xaa-Ser system radical SAM maturase HxsC
MILSGTAIRLAGKMVSNAPFVGRISENIDLPEGLRTREILRLATCSGSVPPGFRAYLFDNVVTADPPLRDAFLLASEFHYLADGDIVRIDPARGVVTTLFRRSSPSNSFLVTERCDNRCLMCSQPPAERDDRWIVEELNQVIPLVAPDTKEIGITGGEPALIGADLIGLLGQMKQYIPGTAVHLLSNGRGFSDRALAQALASVEHPDLVIGVPLHSDLAEEHDYIAQRKGAFDETVRGILNLKQAGVRVEIRFVVHAESRARLSPFAEFVARNLLFVDHVALMGLEMVGFARANLSLLWIDPVDYQADLLQAVRHLRWAGTNVSIYNVPLCVLPPELHPFARQSISDWKNVYFGECDGCARRKGCCGFFTSGVVRKSRGVKPFRSVASIPKS